MTRRAVNLRNSKPTSIGRLQHAALALLCVALCSCVDTSAPPSKVATLPTAPGESEPSVFAEFAKSRGESAKPQVTEAAFVPASMMDVAAAMGLEFTYQNGATGQQLMVEATGGGCGWLDYDRDSEWDMYVVQGGDPTATADQAAGQPRDSLYRRLSRGFEDIAAIAGIDEPHYGQGVSVGDFDEDGFPDLFVTNVGPDRLFRNLGDGTFEDVSGQSGVADSLWSTSSAWGDVDRDGDLDLYVCNYCDYDPRNPRACYDPGGQPSICHPKDVPPVPDEFFVNLGDGRFEASARRLGLFGEGNRGLGIVIGDMDNDDWPDLYVANDTTPNFLFLNKRAEQFPESAVLLGCAVNADGTPQASMGVACADFDRNGYLDLYLTHFTNEWNTLYANYGPQGFADVTALNGLVIPTMPMLAFGTVMNDFNGDGHMDLFIANGHINDRRTVEEGYAMPAQLFGFDGKHWHDLAASGGPYFQRRTVGRGVATCDFNRDGRLDVAVIHQNSPLALLENQSAPSSWLELSFLCRGSNRNGIGTRVHVTCGSETWMAELIGGGSYCSGCAACLHFGLGGATGPCTVEVRWPDGRRQILDSVLTNQHYVVFEPSRSESRAAPRFQTCTTHIR